MHINIEGIGEAQFALKRYTDGLEKKLSKGIAQSGKIVHAPTLSLYHDNEYWI